MNRRLCSAALVGVCLAMCVPAFGGTITTTTQAKAEQIRYRLYATKFLDHATFGATKAEANALATRMQQIGIREAAEEWIDQQFAVPATYLEPLALDMIADDGFDPLQTNIGVHRYRRHAYWHAAVAAPDQLRQRVAWALIQICVINDGMFGAVRNDHSGQPHYMAPLSYYDMLLRNSFGNYRDVLMDVTRHPCMGRFLSHLRNRKANPAVNRYPDENFAREIMQLFSIGLYELESDGELRRDINGDLIPTYDNEDIKAFARVFTGFSYAGHTNFWGWPDNSHDPMAMFDSQHDMEEKTLLNGQILPAGQTGLQDVNGAIDNLMNHNNIAPFIGRRLIQRLVKSNPDRDYMARVSSAFNDNGQGVRGDMQAVVKAILLDDAVFAAFDVSIRNEGPGVWKVDVTNTSTEDSRFMEPVVRYASFLRKFDGQSDYPTGRIMINSMAWNWTQGFMRSPSVFNFYLPDFQPPGDIVEYQTSTRIPNGSLHAPEFELFTAVTANRTPNRYRWDVYSEKSQQWLLNNSQGQLRSNVLLNFDEEKQLAADPVQLVDHLDVHLAHGNLDESMRQALITALTEETTDTTARARAAILSVLVAPQNAITR